MWFVLLMLALAFIFELVQKKKEAGEKFHSAEKFFALKIFILWFIFIWFIIGYRVNPFSRPGLVLLGVQVVLIAVYIFLLHLVKNKTVK